MLLPAEVAVGVQHLHLFIAQAVQSLSGLLSQFREDLDGLNVRAELRQDGCLVAAAGADLQHLVAGLDF